MSVVGHRAEKGGWMREERGKRKEAGLKSKGQIQTRQTSSIATE